jgi:hypothetical protein
MTLHAFRGVPWLVVLFGVAPVPALLRIVEQWPYTMWPLQGIAVGMVAAAAVWCFDETAAAVIDTLPRSLAWRTTSRLLGVAVILGVWLVSVSWTSSAYFGRPGHVAWQGVAAIAAGSAYATWRRSRGTATPALGAATGLVCGASFLALTRPLDDRLPVFPYLDDGPWTLSAVLWTVIGVASVAVLAVLLLEPATGQDHRRGDFG